MQTFGDELKPFAPKIYIVNCPKCGAALKVKDGAAVYACGACNYLFQIRKIAQDVTEERVEPQEEEAKEESLEMQTPEAENTAEEPCDESAETPVEAEESKEEVEWNPTIDEEDSEDGWEEDNRQIDMPVWQEEEAEEGWDEE